jgi:hypothetical protein
MDLLITAGARARFLIESCAVTHSTDLRQSAGTRCESSVSPSFNFRSGRPTVQSGSPGALAGISRRVLAEMPGFG